MINRRKRQIVSGSVTLTALALTGAALVGLSLTGCGKAEEPVVQRQTAPPPPPPPPAPTYTSIEQLKIRLGIDDRVEWAEENAPRDDAIRTAVLTFFDAQVRGDDRTFGEMIPFTEKLELNAMVEEGVWQDVTSQIERVEITAGQSPEGERVVLALITVDFDYQPQMWFYQKSGNDFTFEAVPTPPDVMMRLSGTDWIEAWFRLLAEELELARRPSIEVNIPQINLDEGGGATPMGDQPSTPSGTPGTPQGPGRRPPPTGPPITPIGPGAPGGG